MVKKILLLCFSLAFSAGLFAQSTDATISASQIRYWVGSGSHEVVFAVNFGSPDTCLAWGFRFTADSVTVEEMMDSIAASDPRFSYSGSNGYLSSIQFVDANNNTYGLDPNSMYGWMYNVNGVGAQLGYSSQYVYDGDFVKWGDAEVATSLDMNTWTNIWTRTVTPVDPPAGASTTATDATINPASIKYWVGTGNNEVVFAVNWGNPDTCLAWGYRFSADSILVSDMMNDIQAADPRFSFDSSNGAWGPVLNDIYFVKAPADTLKLTGSYWMYNVNGQMAQLGFGSQYVQDGDFVKFGDISIAIVNDTDQWGYPSELAWTNTVTPVKAPEATISASRIKYWVGTGSNEVVFAVNWANPDTCLAWGYRFSADSVTVFDIIDAIATADYRFNYDSSMSAYGALINDLRYAVNATDTLGLAGMWWTFNVNGLMAPMSCDYMYVKNGDFVKFGDESIAITNDTAWGYPSEVAWTAPVTPVYVPEAIIAASDIVYWVGTGSNEVVFAVNWANPDTCLAWGYRFSADSVLISDMMNDIQAADPRFSFDSLMGSYGPYLTDIVFTTATDTLKLAGYYWTFNVNGEMAQLGFGEQYVKNGDFVKFGDESVGFANDSAWGYPSNVVWTKPVTPVPAPQPVGIASANASSFSVYPNPASSYVMVSAEGIEANSHIVLMDATGRTIVRKQVEGTVNQRISLDGLAKGVYFVGVASSNSVKVNKLIVK